MLLQFLLKNVLENQQDIYTNICIITKFDLYLVYQIRCLIFVIIYCFVSFSLLNLKPRNDQRWLFISKKRKQFFFNKNQFCFLHFCRLSFKHFFVFNIILTNFAYFKLILWAFSTSNARPGGTLPSAIFRPSTSR